MSFYSIQTLLEAQKRSVLAEEYPDAAVGFGAGFLQQMNVANTRRITEGSPQRLAS